MPPLQCCSKTWHFSSDDLPLPALGGVCMHLLWCILLGMVLGKGDIPCTYTGEVGIIIYFAICIVVAVLYLWLMVESGRGGMLQEYKRRRVPLVLQLLGGGLVVELAALIYVTVVAAYGAVTAEACHSDVTPEQQARLQSTLKGFIITTWVLNGILVAGSVALYKTYPESGEESWAKRLTCISRAMCCADQMAAVDGGEANDHEPPLARVARSMAYLFADVRFTLTDVLNGLVLVAASHKHLDDAESPTTAQGGGALDAVRGWSSAGTTGGEQDVDAADSDSTNGGHLASPSNLSEGEEAPTLADLQDALCWLRYADAAYRQSFDMWMPNPTFGETRRTRMDWCSDCSRSTLKPHDDEGKSAARAEAAEEGRACQTNEVSGEQRHVGLLERDLVWSSTENTIGGLLPYFIALNRERRCVVLAIRGTMSTADILSDVLFEPVPLSREWISGSDGRPAAPMPPSVQVIAPRHHLSAVFEDDVGSTPAASPLTLDASNARSQAATAVHENGHLRERTTQGSAQPAGRVLRHTVSASARLLGRAEGLGAALEVDAPTAIGTSEAVPAQRAAGIAPTNALLRAMTLMANGSMSGAPGSPGVVPDSGVNGMPDSGIKGTPGDAASAGQWHGHGAMVACASAIRDELAATGLLGKLLLGQAPAGTGGSMTDGAGRSGERKAPGTAGVLGPAAADDCRGWTLLITGHSLGAGVASLLAVHYRAVFPDVRCWAFAPPGGCMSPAASASLLDVCTSVVIAEDVIPRLSLWTIERLRDEMMLAALRARVPKWLVLARLVLRMPQRAERLMTPLEQLNERVRGQWDAYTAARQRENLLDPAMVRVAREMLPPGRVLWLQRRAAPPKATGSGAAAPESTATAAGPSAADTTASTLQGTPGAALPRALIGRSVVIPRWVSATDMIAHGIVVAPTMVDDHMPRPECELLQQVLLHIGAAQATPAASGSLSGIGG